VYGRDDFTCRDCGTRFHPRTDPYEGDTIVGLTLGHVIPQSKGGPWTVENLIAQCRWCNEDLDDDIWTGPRYLTAPRPPEPPSPTAIAEAFTRAGFSPDGGYRLSPPPPADKG
jgi:5-methylcytosine-specific restriction endonuclease McrA